MKITHVDVQLIRRPADEPLTGGPNVKERGDERDIIVVQIRTDSDGIDGVGFTCFPGYYAGGLSFALRRTLEHLGELAIGQDPLRIEATMGKLKAATHFGGPGGILTLALSAIDIALWDIKGKHAGQSVSAMAGGFRKSVPAYASGILQRGHPLDHVVKTAPVLVEKGFTQMKMQLGLGGRPEREIERARKVREALGPGIDLMCDVNQRWSVHDAIVLGRRLEDEGVNFFWLEDVTAYDDYQGQARVAAALATPLAGGEYVFGIQPMRQMIEAGSVDIVMIDLVRVGGITDWLKVAAMAEAHNLPVVSHIMPEISAQLVAAVPNGLTVEYISWGAALFEETAPVVKGVLTLPDKPGLGLRFNQDVLKRYRVA